MRSPHRRSRLAAAVVVVLAGPGLVTGCAGGADGGGGGGTSATGAQQANPYAGREGYADPASPTAVAAARAEAGRDPDDQRVYSRLAQTPQGIWLTPEEYPPGHVAEVVTRVVDAADQAGEVPTFVVYGIPDRDCTGGFSEGGLTSGAYGPWVREIAEAAGQGDHVAVVVEPDALASALECDRREERIRLISDAVTAFRHAGVTTYVDGGHSHWVDPARLAVLLREVGVAGVRGFATNVANYQTDADERAYGEKLSVLLGGAHYVIDSGRNGNGSTRNWCNPTGRAYGTDPTAAPAGDAPHLDAYLWIKPPGESDGECGGGPPAGRFWPQRARQMAASSGW